MRCKKCGKVIRKDERFCEGCGYYNGEKDSSGWDDSFDDISLDEEETEPEKEETFEEFDLKTEADDKPQKFHYENEDLLEAYIGEDYKMIKKIPFNIYAFLLNWSYVLYRKLYITGILGLIVTAVIAIYFREIIFTYWLIMMVALGILFNFYYVFVAKRRVEHIKNKYSDLDRFGIVNICEEKGGVNLFFALIAYIIFLAVIILNYVNIFYNPDHNPKFWKENTENKATCNSLIKVSYNNLETYKVPGTIEEAVCKISKANFPEYDVYMKTKDKNKTYYAYFHAETDGLVYKRNTSEINSLELKKANGLITDEEQALLNSLKQIENNYSDISRQSKKEDELINSKKNKSEKLNFIFSKEEIIR